MCPRVRIIVPDAQNRIYALHKFRIDRCTRFLLYRVHKSFRNWTTYEKDTRFVTNRGVRTEKWPLLKKYSIYRVPKAGTRARLPVKYSKKKRSMLRTEIKFSVLRGVPRSVSKNEPISIEYDCHFLRFYNRSSYISNEYFVGIESNVTGSTKSPTDRSWIKKKQ